MAKQSQTKEEKKVPTPLEQLSAYLEHNKEYFYNHVQEPSYVVSSGSLKLDIEMGGGLRPGVLRFTGVTEGGKTNCALSFARNFLNTVDNSYVIYFRAEGRLSEETLVRQGLFNHPRFQIVKGNVYEKVISCISDLINNNPTGAKYLFIIDSMDALIPLGDLAKKPEEALKVAGGSVLSSDMLRRMANKFVAFGHSCIITSQVRSQVKINQYEKSDPKVTNASGGNAMLHYSDWILEFQYRYFGDTITSEADQKGDILGHNCKVVFRKTPNEKTYVRVEYPIRYGRQNGQSIWIEKEIFDVMLAFGLLVKNAGWVSFIEPLLVELKTAGIECPDKVNGEKKFSDLLEENPKLTEFLYKKLCNTLKK